jgi:hypothetical protein
MHSGDFDLLRGTGTGTTTDKRCKRSRVRVGSLSKTTATVLLGVMVTSLVLVSNAFALPKGRHYEMVSPVYKGGCGAGDIEEVAPDGESVAFYSLVAFSRRVLRGWLIPTRSVRGNQGGTSGR